VVITSRVIRRALMGSALVAVGLIIALVTGLLTSSADVGTSPPELQLPAFGGGGTESSSENFSAQSLLGQPDVDELAGEGFAVVPGQLGGATTVTDACTGLEGFQDYADCPAGIRSTTVLKTTDWRRGAPACEGTRRCTTPQSGADVKVYDRAQFPGLTVGTIALTKSPGRKLFSDIFESDNVYLEAGGADFGCITDGGGTCTAGVRQTRDLLLLVRFVDGTKTIYSGRKLSTSSFIDSNDDSIQDLATKTMRVTKIIEKNGKVTYSGTKTNPVDVA
jgi:hypothetical protein